MCEQKLWPAVITGVALIVGAALFGGFYYSAQALASKDVLSTVGSTKTRVTSDRGKLTISLTRTVLSGNLSTGYRDIARDLNLTKDLLKKSGLDGMAVVEGPVSMNQLYDQNNPENIRYQLNQIVTAQSEDVGKITDISKKIPELAGQGVIVSIQSLEYYYSKLPELRVSLLAKAVEDAKARAEQIAQGTGRHIGQVEKASAGVVQVLSPNSVDISDYGNYDTSSIEKDVMVTVSASFRLE